MEFRRAIAHTARCWCQLVHTNTQHRQRTHKRTRASMPTLILLDRSLSTAYPAVGSTTATHTSSGSSSRAATSTTNNARASPVAGPSRLDGLKEAVTHFINTLAVVHPLEYIGLAAFASSLSLRCNFTQLHSEVLDALAQVDYAGTSDLANSLYDVPPLLADMWDAHALCQIVVVTDGELDVDVQKCMVQFPVAVKVHVVSVRDCSEPFGEQLAAARLSSLSSVAATYSGSCFSTAAPTSRCSSYSLAAKNAFDDLFNSCYKVYFGKLCCGRLAADFRVFPDPNLCATLSSTPPSTSNTSARSSYAGNSGQQSRWSVPLLPPVLSIRGFLPVDSIPSPPSLARYSVVRLDYEQDTKPAPSFLTVLSMALRKQDVVALAQLDNGYHALIRCESYKSNKGQVLLIDIVADDAGGPLVGNLSQLVNAVSLEETLGTSVAQSSYGPGSVRVPAYPATTKSYIARKEASPFLPFFNADGASTDVSRAVRLSQSLPAKCDALYNELSYIRKTACVFNAPELLTTTAAAITEANPQPGAILLDIIGQLEEGNIAADIRRHPAAPTKGGSKKRKSTSSGVKGGVGKAKGRPKSGSSAVKGSSGGKKGSKQSATAARMEKGKGSGL